MFVNWQRIHLGLLSAIVSNAGKLSEDSTFQKDKYHMFTLIYRRLKNWFCRSSEENHAHWTWGKARGRKARGMSDNRCQIHLDRGMHPAQKGDCTLWQFIMNFIKNWREEFKGFHREEILNIQRDGSANHPNLVIINCINPLPSHTLPHKYVYLLSVT
jgi:hypothetical protein